MNSIPISEKVMLSTAATGISFEAKAQCAMWECTRVNVGLPGTCPLPMIGDCVACALFETLKLVFGEVRFEQWEQEVNMAIRAEQKRRYDEYMAVAGPSVFAYPSGGRTGQGNWA